MIPDIGFIVGTYVLTRMMQIFFGDGLATKVSAALTSLVTLISIADLVLHGSSGPMR